MHIGGGALNDVRRAELPSLAGQGVVFLLTEAWGLASLLLCVGLFNKKMIPTTAAAITTTTTPLVNRLRR